jgi:hypothetical protein
MNADPSRKPLTNFFAGITEQAFEATLGVADPPLIDYLVELLTRFVRTDAVFAGRDLQGRRLSHLGDLLLEAESRVGDARRSMHRHIGDFTLFWAGVYPEALNRPATKPGRRERFEDYLQHGKRSYRIASQLPAGNEQAESENEVLERLSQEFELCAYGLGEVRREWERRDGGEERRITVIL